MVVHSRYPIGETRVEREARALVDHGYQVDTICLKEENEPLTEIVDGITIYRLPVKRHQGNGAGNQLLEYFAFFILAFFKLLTLHLQQHYKVIHIHNIPDLLVFVGLLPKLMGARVILDLHDLMPEFYAVRFNRKLDSWPVRLIILAERISCQFADQVITVTNEWRNILLQRGVPASKLNVIMNVPDERIFHSSIDPSEAPTRTKNGFQLLYHGNLTQRYGIDLAIQAVSILHEQIPNIHLYIHGGGDYRRALIEMTHQLGLDGFVDFNTHPIMTSELPDLIRGADVCLVPYRSDIFTDGILPTKLMEYAALEMPVIAARTPAIQAYFTDAMVEFFEPGNLDDLARCIHKLYRNPTGLSDLKHGIRLFKQVYNWARISREYVILINRLCHKAETERNLGVQ
jgi:glycosyltransferase involved in cell wall biosynthesis